MRLKPRIPEALRFAADELDRLDDLDEVSRSRVVGPTAIMLRAIADIVDVYGPRRYQEIEESREILEQIISGLKEPLGSRARQCLEEARSVDLSLPMDRLDNVADQLDQLFIELQELSSRGEYDHAEAVRRIDTLFAERAARWLPPMPQPASPRKSLKRERQ